MIKIIGSLLIISGTTILGFILSENLKKRVKELRELERTIYQLQNEILYTHTPIPEALKIISKKGIKPISEILLKVSEELMSNNYDSIYDAFFYVFKHMKDKVNLKDEDITEVLDFTRSLGESDINGQVKMFSLTLINLKKRIDEAELAMKKNVKMYRYLGFAFGAMIVILLI